MQIALTFGNRVQAIEIVGFQVFMQGSKQSEWGLYDPLRGYLMVGGELVAHGIHSLVEAVERYAQWIIDTDDGRSLRPSEVVQCLSVRPSVVAGLPSVSMEEVEAVENAEWFKTEVMGVDPN